MLELRRALDGTQRLEQPPRAIARTMLLPAAIKWLATLVLALLLEPRDACAALREADSAAR